MKWIFLVVAFCTLNIIVPQSTDDDTFVRVINNQSDLEQLWTNPMIAAPPEGPSRNITIQMAANIYILDIPKFVRALNLADGDILTIAGPIGGITDISCVDYNTSSNDDLDILRNASFANAAKIVCNGITFTRCQAPLRIENVSTVIVENCVFQ